MSGGRLVGQRVGQTVVFRLAVAGVVLVGLVAHTESTAQTSQASGVRLAASSSGSTLPSSGGGGGSLQVDFVDALHGFALDPLPSINDGDFPAAPSVLVSTNDGGKSWKSTPFPRSVGVVSDVSFVSPTTGWAVSFVSPGGAEQYSAILMTTNAGASWTMQTVPTLPQISFFDYVDFADAQHGWVVGDHEEDAPATHPLVLATSDGGQHWSAQTLPASMSSGRLHGVFFTSDTTGWVTGQSTAPFIASTTDGGSSWMVQSLPTAVSTVGNLSAVATTAWVSGSINGADGQGVVLKSVSGGSWNEETFPTTAHGPSVAFSSSANGWAVALDPASNSIAFHTTNGGVTWTEVSALPLEGVTGVAAISGAGAWVVGYGSGCSEPAIAKTTDGSSWRLQLSMAPIRAQLSTMSFPTASTGFVIVKDCSYHVLRTTDGARTWSPVAPFPVPFQAVAVAFPTRSHGWVVGDDPSGCVLFATSDGATTWKPQTLPTGFCSFSQPAFGDVSHGWIPGNDQSGSAVLIGTSDGGSHWASESIPAQVSSLSGVAAAGPSNVWAVGDTTTSGGGTSAIAIASKDGGASWTVQAIPAGINYLQSVEFIDTLHGWAVGYDSNFDSLLLVTSDGGTSWHAQTTAPPNLDEVSFTTASVGWASTRDGVFSTTDGGTSWTKQPGSATFPSIGRIHALSTSLLVGEGGDALGFVGIARSNNGGSLWSESAIFDPAWATISPTSAAAGSTVTLTGHGFDPNETVKIRWTSTTGSVLATLTADANGAFTASFTLPSTTSGSHKIYAVGQLSLAAPYVSFSVT